MTAERRPIYAVLGARPDVSPALARELYWRRIGRLRTGRLGEDELGEAFADLNWALEIVMDERRRREYDAAHGVARRMLDSTKIHTRALAFRSTLATTAGVLAGGQLHGVAALGIAMTTWSVATAGALALTKRDARPDVLGQLQLSEDATLDDLELAYRSLADEWLVQIGLLPDAIARLEQLDRIYARAVVVLSERARNDLGPAAPPDRPILVQAEGRLALATAHHERRPLAAPDGNAPRLRLASAATADGVAVAGRPCVLGRDGGCDLRLAGIDVAPQHAVVSVTRGALVLHVLEPGVTANVNGRAMRWAVLEDGDVIEIGLSRVIVAVPRDVAGSRGRRAGTSPT
ncbi:MAG: FHA domain-containing protein [Dehalococcoidia bacterium]|nr:MAG: FHA domain-containing protein [Dehalococcoidia bacterium]